MERLTPKEKANELIIKIEKSIALGYDDFDWINLDYDSTIKLALLWVDEILEGMTNQINQIDSIDTIYWLKVKDELNQL